MSSLFTHYVALGDSISIDLYPALDAGDMEVAVALERRPGAGAVGKLGAASLFYQNDDARWPDFAGDDLRSRYQGITLTNLASDGATIGDVYGEQLAEVAESARPTVVTLSAGGNDLLSAYASRPGTRLMASVVRDVSQAFAFLVERLVDLRPNARLLLTTVYDPSDGSRSVPGLFDGDGPLPLEHLDALNDEIRNVADRVPQAVLADVHAHFLGHGATADLSDQWYWKRSLIEPNARGASEVRRVWLEALRA